MIRQPDTFPSQGMLDTHLCLRASMASSQPLSPWPTHASSIRGWGSSVRVANIVELADREATVGPNG